MPKADSVISTLISALILFFFSFEVHAVPFIGEELTKKLKSKSDGPYKVIVGLHDPDDGESIKSIPDYTDNIGFRSRKTELLKDLHQQSRQMALPFEEKYKKSKSASIESIWIANALIVTAGREFIDELVNNPAVKSIHLPRTIKLDEPIIENPYSKYNKYTYGLVKMRIPQLHEDTQLPVIDGDGVRVGLIDTGVNPKHPDLAGKVISFKDFVYGQKDPYDDNNHGSHVAGTIAGGDASGVKIGVAPGSQLLVAKAFDSAGYSSDETLLRAMQWLADPDGDPATDDGPIVVNNSWGSLVGSMQEELPFIKAVENWVELGIFPCFAAGNSGDDPRTISSPGGFPHSFSVGATAQDDSVPFFSSRGPFRFEGIDYHKPDVGAPGFRVLSASADGGYMILSGTSMATPHVTGLVALIAQTRPDLSVHEIAELIKHTSFDVQGDGYDFNMGWGRVDAYAALTQIISVQYQLPLAYKRPQQ